MPKNIAWLGIVLTFSSILSVVVVEHSNANIIELMSAHSTKIEYLYGLSNPFPLLLHHYTVAISISIVMIFYVVSFKTTDNQGVLTFVCIFLLFLYAIDMFFDYEGAVKTTMNCFGSGVIEQRVHFFLGWLSLCLWAWVLLQLQFCPISRNIHYPNALLESKVGLRVGVFFGIMLLFLLSFNPQVWKGERYSQGVQAVSTVLTRLLKSPTELEKNVSLVLNGHGQLLAEKDRQKAFGAILTGKVSIPRPKSENAIAINFILSHSILGGIVAFILALFAIYVIRNMNSQMVVISANILIILVVASVISGLSLVFYSFSLPWVNVIHTGFVILLVTPLLAINGCKSREKSQ